MPGVDGPVDQVAGHPVGPSKRVGELKSGAGLADDPQCIAERQLHLAAAIEQLVERPARNVLLGDEAGILELTEVEDLDNIWVFNGPSDTRSVQIGFHEGLVFSHLGLNTVDHEEPFGAGRALLSSEKDLGHLTLTEDPQKVELSVASCLFHGGIIRISVKGSPLSVAQKKSRVLALRFRYPTRSRARD